MIVENRVG